MTGEGSGCPRGFASRCFVLLSGYRGVCTFTRADARKAHNGEESLVQLSMVGYDVVLLDIDMPRMGGKEICRRINQTLPGLPVIMLTVCEAEEDVVECLDAGAFDYSTKPFQIRELTARLRSVIRRSKRAPESKDLLTVVGNISLDAERHILEKRGEKFTYPQRNSRPCGP
jgi:two-component system KDP operon response regulator KdpE